MQFAGYMAKILLCKQRKSGEKICYNSGDIEFFLGDCFLLAHPVQRYTAELQDRAPLQAQSSGLDRESSYKRPSQLALDHVASPASQAYVERLFSLGEVCGDLTARKRNRTRMSL